MTKLHADYITFALKSESQYRRAIFLTGFLFYLICLAPTVLWGDEAAYQAEAFLLRLAPTPDSHPIFLVLAHPFTYLPFGDIAYRVNLASAIFSALTLSVVFSITRYYTDSLPSRLFATAILCVSHTFWEYGVRANPYSLTALFFALTWFSILAWINTRKIQWLLLGCATFIFGSAHHLLMLITLPGFFIVLFPSLRGIINRRLIFYFFALAVLLATLFFIIAPVNKFIVRTYDIMWPIFWPPQLKTATIAQGIGLLLYNTQICLLFCVVGFKLLFKSSRTEAIGILFLIIIDFLFTALLNYPPAYMYYLPIVIILSILCAPGIAYLKPRIRILSWPLIFAISILWPIIIYRITPVLMRNLDLHIPHVRDLPGRDAETFYLWPPKSGIRGARLYGEIALNSVPDNSLILADGTTAKTLWYLQDVDGLRKDVSVIIDIPFELQAEYLRVQSEKYPVYLADTQLYYNVAEISKYFSIHYLGPIYSLRLLNPYLP